MALPGNEVRAQGGGLKDTFGKIEFPKLFKRNQDTLEETAQAPDGPGGLCLLPNGDFIISCHPFFDPEYRVMRLTRDGKWKAFPNLQMNVPGSGASPGEELDSVVGICCDEKGVVWMLDNGSRSETQEKIVGWDSKRNELQQIIPIFAVRKTSFLRNITLDPNHPFAYISDPAGGDDAAIIVVNLSNGRSRRVLEGHESVRPQRGVGIQLDGKFVEVKRADGGKTDFLSGVSALAVDRKGTWLYYGPRDGTTLFRIRTDLLRDAALSPDSLKTQVKGFSVKPICDSIAIDSKNNVYFTDIARGSIDYVTPEDDYLNLHLLVQDPRIVWPGGLKFGDDGRLHFFSNQLHRTKIFNSGKDVTEPPFYLFSVKPLSTRFLGGIGN
ncbi:MAG: hypothetical protein HKN23_12130 [Verrucomicrobiales bacterium]|nr:hypothetical protein [Verrucomicrobiales bacterium]